MEELTSYSAARLAAMMRRREVSPVEVVGAYLRRAELVNPRLNAVVALAPDALERAREAEGALMRGGAAGALCGVPLTVKDTLEVKNLRSAAGSRARAGYVAERDAGAVARLRAAGAVILGKTNSAELALDYTSDNPVYGRTNNPFDAARSPGGSSGGCAAAVSACLTAASLGSDLSGSVRIPAHFCGVVSLKPTAGRVPRSGHYPPVEGAFALGASVGPIARRVEDLALLFEVLSGEGVARAGGGGRSGVDGVAALRATRCAWYADDGVVPVTEETREAVVRAAHALKDAGCAVAEERPPGVGRGNALWLALFSRHAREFVRGVYEGREDEAGPAARALLRHATVAETGAPDDYAKALAERERLRRELLGWMDGTPLFVAPVGAVAAFEHGARKVSAGGEEVGVFRAFGYAQAFNVFDLPAACVPAGKSREGLPVGVQLAGRPGAEREVLAAARVVEEALGGWRRPPEAL